MAFDARTPGPAVAVAPGALRHAADEAARARARASDRADRDNRCLRPRSPRVTRSRSTAGPARRSVIRPRRGTRTAIAALRTPRLPRRMPGDPIGMATGRGQRRVVTVEPGHREVGLPVRSEAPSEGRGRLLERLRVERMRVGCREHPHQELRTFPLDRFEVSVGTRIAPAPREQDAIALRVRVWTSKLDAVIGRASTERRERGSLDDVGVRERPVGARRRDDRHARRGERRRLGSPRGRRARNAYRCRHE